MTAEIGVTPTPLTPRGGPLPLVRRPAGLRSQSHSSEGYQSRDARTRGREAQALALSQCVARQNEITHVPSSCLGAMALRWVCFTMDFSPTPPNGWAPAQRGACLIYIPVSRPGPYAGPRPPDAPRSRVTRGRSVALKIDNG
ncbi:hypothetical protein TCAL_15138 [Tigriopus californicus]|uniref:Uncharacterized protein n=1 Tax=Tigriopus californicus TaxID=6832 RepID=A0A553NVR1_TIGCA|nr:hypothetical protein TCAL_15138 [Tigriopus californicus]